MTPISMEVFFRRPAIVSHDLVRKFGAVECVTTRMSTVLLWGYIEAIWASSVPKSLSNGTTISELLSGNEKVKTYEFTASEKTVVPIRNDASCQCRCQNYFNFVSAASQSLLDINVCTHLFVDWDESIAAAVRCPESPDDMTNAISNYFPNYSTWFDSIWVGSVWFCPKKKFWNRPSDGIEPAVDMVNFSLAKCLSSSFLNAKSCSFGMFRTRVEIQNIFLSEKNDPYSPYPICPYENINLRCEDDKWLSTKLSNNTTIDRYAMIAARPRRARSQTLYENVHGRKSKYASETTSYTRTLSRTDTRHFHFSILICVRLSYLIKTMN